jgi:hypothetical protein
LGQPLREPQAQHLAYLPHRQSLARHSDPLLLSKGSGLPTVEDCQQQRPTVTRPTLFMITGTGVHDQPDSVFTIDWNAQQTGTAGPLIIPVMGGLVPGARGALWSSQSRDRSKFGAAGPRRVTPCPHHHQ